MTTQPASGTASSPSPAAGSSLRPSSAALKDQFLQLLIAQLRNQDPMRPMEDREFITQLAQFAVLEQLESLDQEFKQASAFAQLGAASGLIGRTVAADDGSGSVISGRVSAVLVDPAGRITLKVGDKTVPLNAVRKILSEEG